MDDLIINPSQIEDLKRICKKYGVSYINSATIYNMLLGLESETEIFTNKKILETKENIRVYKLQIKSKKIEEENKKEIENTLAKLSLKEKILLKKHFKNL